MIPCLFEDRPSPSLAKVGLGLLMTLPATPSVGVKAVYPMPSVWQLDPIALTTAPHYLCCLLSFQLASEFPHSPVPPSHHQLCSVSGEPLRISISDSLPSTASLLSRSVSSFSFSSISWFLFSLPFVYVVPVCACVCMHVPACLCAGVCVV